MKKQNGFIATSLLYTFFLAFVTLFIGVVTIHLQNRVYLNKLEDSSKNSIYLREMKRVWPFLRFENDETYYGEITKIEENVFTYKKINSSTGNEISINNVCNLAKCEIIYYYSQDDIYILEGCEC